MEFSGRLMDDGPHEDLKRCFHNIGSTFPDEFLLSGNE
jgi:hypothetical protein